MNGEAAVVNLFFTFRVFFVGAILLALPRISRRGLFFGTYLGEEQVEGVPVAKLKRAWDIGSVIVMAVSLMIGWGISLTVRPVPGNLTGTAVLIVASVALYLWMYGKARRLTPPDAVRQAMKSSASLEVDEAHGDGFAKFALAACLTVALASAVHATLAYEAMPERIPTLANLIGHGDELTDKSIVTVVLFPSFNLVFTPFFALTGLLIAGAKRSVRGGSGGRSAEAQNAFRAATSHIFSGTALFLCLILAVTSLEVVRVTSGRAESLGIIILWCMVAMLVYVFASLFRIFRNFGQGGARLETGSAEAPLAGGLADNAHWHLGMTYINRDDPSIMVESRFLFYTFNLGNRTALVILSVFWAACLGLVALTLLQLGLFS